MTRPATNPETDYDAKVSGQADRAVALDGRPHDVINAPARPFEVFAHNESQFHFETRLEEPTSGKSEHRRC